MTLIERGKVQCGGIIFSEPLAFPEGTEVIIRIESLEAAQEDLAPTDIEHFAALPFFGMWADLEEMTDSAAWVRKEREKWQPRVIRQD